MFFRKQKGSAQIIVAAILLLIAFFIVIMFRSYIAEWMKQLSSYFSGRIGKFS